MAFLENYILGSQVIIMTNPAIDNFFIATASVLFGYQNKFLFLQMLMVLPLKNSSCRLNTINF